MKTLNKTSRFLKLLLLLLVISLVWFFVVMEMLYNLFFQEIDNPVLFLDYAIQLKIVYVLGVFIIVAYSTIILMKTKNENKHKFN
ncbi:hypothetical protein SY27_11885 [Flavobacterium sp. 316]|uniref:Uncharacterized protein n=1 Tax=Flavobacterium sediminilitoris TaxID=2024526 RepID=A0ABY4HPK1_9FLAO|nr:MULTISPECIES: hypothetical protein [Flavobacterium]KIX20601.1 hypothetical protein SY27_11885 [Flavobacterium sp. 316]UOX34811.1 hypothetical protein LXD69_04705 [Flavobacterium sediminilitoris]